MKFVFPAENARTINKWGVDITIFDENVDSVNIVYEETSVGHLEEFYDDVSTHVWFIIEGQGTFVIDDELIEVKPKDLVVVPPNMRIHYFGSLKMVLCTSPAFKPENEHHVREVPESESPYF